MSDSSSSGPEDRKEVVKKEKSPDEVDGKLNLGNNKLAQVREFKGKVYVDIREYYKDDEGQLKPGKKGVSLAPSQFEKFVNLVPRLEEYLKKQGN